MREVRTEIDIDAPPSAVWGALVDFARWPDWNPLIRRMDGVPEVGAAVRLTLELVPGRTVRARGHVVDVEPEALLGWAGGAHGLLLAHHWLALEARPDGGTRVVHVEQFEGLIPWLLWRPIHARLSARHPRMNAALKAYVEAHQG